MFLKNNKYKDLIVALVTTITLLIVLYKLMNSLDIIFIGVLSKFISLTMPFIYAMVIAYILNPIVMIIEKKYKVSRGISIFVTYIILGIIISIICIYGIPNLFKNIKEIVSEIPSYITLAQEFVYNVLEDYQIKEVISNTGVLVDIESYINRFGKVIMNILEDSLSTVFVLSSQLVKFLLGILISIYILVDKERLLREVKRVLILIFKKDKTEKIIEFFKTYHKMIGTYIGIKAIDSTIIGCMAFILLSMVKSEYTLLLAIIVGVTNMIPYFGPFIGEITGLLINIFVSPVKGVIVFLTLFALQMFDGWYLDPKLIGGKVGVRPFWIIFGVVIGGGFFGPLGMLLASATVATIKIYYIKLLIKNSIIVEINEDKR